MAQLDWRDFGAQPGGVVDCTAAINRCFEVAIETKMEAHGPGGVYKTTAPLLWNDPFPRISGEGGLTVIQPDDDDYDWLVCGAGWGTGSVGPAGWIRDLTLRGAPAALAPPGFTAGLKLNGAQFTEVRNVWVEHAPIGIDLINNNYGSSFYNCRTVFDRCRIGIRLSGNRPGMQFASGNDLPFYNCWLHGREAAVWADNFGGGYHFFGGQLNSGIGTAGPSDDRGTVTIGKDLEFGTVTGSNQGMTFYGTSFEFIKNGRHIRAFGTGTSPTRFNLVFSGCVFPAGPAPSGAINVLKISNGYDDSVIFDGCEVTGAYSSAVPVEMGTAPDPANARPCYIERASRGNPTFNGMGRRLAQTPMMVLSQVLRAHAEGTFHTLHDGMMFQTFGGAFQKSVDWGANWSAV